MFDLDIKQVFAKPKWFWVGCSLILLANIIFYFSFVRGKGQEILTLQDTYGKLRAERLLLRKNHSDPLHKLQQGIEEFLSKIPPKQAFPLWVSDLYTHIQKNGLESSKMVYRPERVPLLGLTRYTTSFSVKGEYLKLRQLLADIQNSKQIYCIEGISFVRQSSRDHYVEMKLELSTYFR